VALFCRTTSTHESLYHFGEGTRGFGGQHLCNPVPGFGDDPAQALPGFGAASQNSVARVIHGAPG
jgi:hypothetical protein